MQRFGPSDSFSHSPLQIQLSVKCVKYTLAVMYISGIINVLWRKHKRSIRRRIKGGERERFWERERDWHKALCCVLKIVKQFSRPATFKSIKIDLFVMRGEPFGIPQAWNLREMGVSIRKTEARLKDDGGKERWDRRGELKSQRGKNKRAVLL